MKKYLLFALLLTGCTKKTEEFAASPPVNPQQVCDLINKERTKAKLNPLVIDPVLSNEADRYAKLMASRNILSHNLEGNPQDRFNRIKRQYNWIGIGENIAYNYRSAETVVKGWMSSPGHRQNILNNRFKDTGLSVRYNSRNEPYYCQIFATKR